MTSELDPLELTRMSGPFKGLEDYASALVAHVGDGCEPQSKKVSVAPKKLPRSGEIQEVTLYREATGDSCHPEETCVIGIKSKDQWFTTNRLCSGVIGDALPLSVTDTTLSMSKLGTTPAVVVEYTV